MRGSAIAVRGGGTEWSFSTRGIRRGLLAGFTLVLAAGATASLEAQGSALLSAEDGQPVDQIAPYGVPAPATGRAAGSVVIKAYVPGFVGNQFRLTIRSLAGGGGPMDGLGDAPGLPPVALEGEQGLLMKRMASRGFEEGYQWFLSEPLAVIADPRASAAYTRTARENEQCVRCDGSRRPAGARELLSGETIAVEWPAELLTPLGLVYGTERVRESQLRIPSVRWETAPSTRQEPSRQVSTGTGEVIPGTLLHSGEVTQSAIDASLPGRGIPVAFERAYRNQTIGSGPLGPGWDHNYRMRLRALPNGDVELYDGRGRREAFRSEEAGGLRPPAGWFVELKRLSSGFELILTDHSTIRFDAHGRMVSLRDRLKIADDAGNELRFRYDASDRLTAIEDDLGQLHKLTYDAAGRLTRFTDATGREWKYGYDAAGLLQTVTTPGLTIGESTFPSGLETRYEYSVPTGTLAEQLAARDDLRSITDPRGLKPVEWDYSDADGDGHAEEVTTERWGGKALGIEYRFEQSDTETTDQVGETRVYGHDATGRLLRIVDPLNHVTEFTLDEEGLVTESIAPLGRATRPFYDQGGRRRSRGNVLRSEVDADDRGPNGSSPRLATQFEYEPYSNLLIKVTDPRGTVTSILRDGVGQALALTEGFGTSVAGTTRHEYDAYGRLTRTTDPDNVVSIVDYGPGVSGRGQSIRTVVDPQNHALESRVERNTRGEMIATIDGRGVRDETVRNELGWVVEEHQAVTSSSDGAPALHYVTRHRHDALGQVVETKSPFGDTGSDFVRSQIDYGLLGEVLASRTEVQPYTGPFVETRRFYDDAFRLIRVQAPEGQLTEQEYDERGLLKSVRRGVGTVDETSESFEYDAEGQRTHATDGLNNTAVTVYDGYGRVSESLDPLGHRTRFEYDDGGNVVKTEALHSSGNVLARTVTVYDERGRAVETRNALLDPEGPGTTRNIVNRVVYDAASKTVESLDARGNSTKIERDSAGRVVVVIDGSGNRQRVTRDENDNAIEIVSVETVPAESGTVEVRETAKYDALGRVIEARDGLGNPSETRYDAQGNVRFRIDAEGFFTESEYDGLGRRTRETRPAGISIEYGYDASGRPISYRDALGNVTTWQYDALDRKVQTTYPDTRVEQMAYDAAGNLREHRDANGNRVAQTFDAANRLIARTIVRGASVEGPAAEIFDYDGLGRLVRAQSGDVAVDRVYDSLSRMTSETSGGRTIAFQHDDTGNPVETTFSNGSKSVRSFDALNRIATIQNAATNGYRGHGLLQRQALGNGLTRGLTFDGARRPTQTVIQQAGVESFSERLAWSPRHLKVAQVRGDQADRGQSFRYDGATRLTEMARADVSAIANNTTPTPLVGASDRFNFDYDAAENLLARSTSERGIEEVLALPLDGSGRNRPGAAGSTDLDWDPNGNLVSKGDLQIVYDYRNRPVRVSRDGQEVASYRYDAFNRRVSATHDGATTETVWNGWQDLETHENGQLVSKRQFGAGLDEIVRQDVDLDGDGTLESQQYPLYDSIGNLTAITDAQGGTVERYEYTPYGEQTIRVDSAPPKVDSVTIRAGVVEVLFSEAVSGAALSRALSGGQASLVRVTDSTPIAVVAEQPQVIGRNAGRRVLLQLAAAPATGEALRLRLEPPAVIDTFQKAMEEAFEIDFNWAADQIVVDTTAPELLEVRAKAGKIEVEFSEEIATAQASAAIQIDGQPLTWQLSDDRFTVTSTTAVSTGSHQLTIPTSLTDPSGNALDEPLAQDFALAAADRFVYRAPEPDVAAESTAKNRFGFHGRDRDPVTGWIYMRNRWYDPELGRFVSQDPLGYVDGPAATAFAGNGPVNSTDPLGLYATDFHYGVTFYLALRAGLPREMARELAESAQRPDDDERSPITSGFNAFAGSDLDCEELRQWHFPRENLTDHVEPGSESAWAVARVGIAAGSYRTLGEGLHPLQDSWAHRGGPGLFSLPGFSIQVSRIDLGAALRGNPFLAGPGGLILPVPEVHVRESCSGHAWFKGTWVLPVADSPWFDRVDALTAAAATYRAIRDFIEANPGAVQPVSKPAPWVDVEIELESFVTADKKGRVEWLKRRGIELPH